MNPEYILDGQSVKADKRTQNDHYNFVQSERRAHNIFNCSTITHTHCLTWDGSQFG